MKLRPTYEDTIVKIYNVFGKEPFTAKMIREQCDIQKDTRINSMLLYMHLNGVAQYSNGKKRLVHVLTPTFIRYMEKRLEAQ